MRSLRSALIDEPLPRLIAIAEVWDVAMDSATSRELADAIAIRASAADTVRDVHAHLPPDSQEALDALISVDGRMALATFERRFGALRPMGPARLERERPWLNPANATEALWYCGFIFRAFDRSATPVDVVYVPGELLEHLAFKPSPIVAVATTTAHPAAAMDALEASSAANQPDRTEAWLLDDCVTTLAHIQSTERIAVADWAARVHASIGPLLRGDAAQFQFVAHLIQQLGWLKTSDDKRMRLNARVVGQWLQRPAAEQLAALREAWMRSADWNDLEHVPGLVLEMRHAWKNEPLNDRVRVVGFYNGWKASAENAGRSWAGAADALCGFVREHHPDFMRVNGRFDTWHIRDAETGKFLSGFEHWDRIEGGLIRHIISDPLSWLTPARDHAPVQAGPALKILVDGRIEIARHFRFERFQLARIAGPTGMISSAEPRYIHQLTIGSLGRAREQGIGAGRVIDFLQRNSAGGLPENLRAAIARWDERGNEVRVEPVVLVRTGDAATLDAVLKLPSMNALMAERIAPNAIAVRQSDAPAVRAAVLEAGILTE